LPRLRRLHAELARHHVNSLWIAQRRLFQAQSPVHFRKAVALQSQRLDLVSIFNGAEMLERVSHDQQEQQAEGNAEIFHLALAARVFDLHQTRVIDGFAEINFRGPQPAGLAPAGRNCALHGHGAHDLCHSKKFRIVVCVFLNRSKPGLDKHGFDNHWFSEHLLSEPWFFRPRPLFRALDRCHQIFDKGACESHSTVPIFLLRTRPCSVFSWPLRENSTTEFFQNLYPARLTITAPGARQFLQGKLKLELTQTFSAARIFALRDRGLRSISSSLAVTGFLVSSRYQPCFAPSRSASLTILSSSE